jgi:hypothetical protein
MRPTMEKTGLPKPHEGPQQPTKEAGEKEAGFPGDHDITERVLQAPQKPREPQK